MKKTEKEYVWCLSCVLWCPKAISWPWPYGQAGNTNREKAAELTLWWWEVRVRVGKVCFTPKGTAHNYGEPCQSWQQKYFQWFLSIRSTEFEAAVTVVKAQPEKYGKDFHVTISYCGQMNMKKCYNIQSVHVAKARIQLAKPKVALFIRKIRSTPR